MENIWGRKTTVIEWENYGDVNPVDHGGVWVKWDDVIGGRNYYVVQLMPVENEEFEEQWYLIDGYVDLDDDWIEWDSVRDTCGTPEDASDGSMVADLLGYYGGEEIGSLYEYHNRDEVVKELERFGITDHNE